MDVKPTGGVITSTLCYVPPSVEFLQPTNPPVFNSRPTTPLSLTRLTPLWTSYEVVLSMTPRDRVAMDSGVLVFLPCNDYCSANGRAACYINILSLSVCDC